MRVFTSRSDATVYTPVAGDTFEQIVKNKCAAAVPPVTTDEAALFNWGTSQPKEVLRALVELIGVKKVDDDPYKCELDPARGPGSPKVYLPKVWKKEGLAYEKVHEVKVKHQLPATAVGITSLDKWFLPGEEACSIAYELEGLKSRAMKVGFDVYASNYCKATAANNGDFVDYTYADTPDVPIIQKSVQTDAAERSEGSVPDWKGESEAADGVLKPRAGSKRYVNAASSPYTVLVRYYKDDAHKNAKLWLQSFWPLWTGAPGSRTVAADTLKIKWTIKDCPGNLQGQLLIFDKDDQVVWRQGLAPALCANGDHMYNWSDGAAIVAEDKMPYRAQIQIHTDFTTDPGLGLAAMHTEVRIFTHKEIGTHGVDHELEPQVLAFAVAPWLPGPAPAEDSAKGRKLRLAKAGYHPGPIADGEGQAEYLQAVREFQRDHMKTGTANRLVNDGTIDADTKTAIAAQAAGRRPLFGQTADCGDITANGEIETALNAKDDAVIAWVDDRHCYTTSVAAPSGTNGFYANMDLGDYRGGMGLGDAKQTTDAATNCRPWLPVMTALPIMRKADTIDGDAVPATNDFSRQATGPIRLDWTFRDLPAEDNVDDTMYVHSRARPRQFLTTTFTAQKGAHNGKDAPNCPAALGGLRGADYYKAPFGIADQSLTPWKALDDSGVTTVCSVAHDDLGQDADRVFADLLGKAGVYLHPSIIAGDGYQFRAQVSFRDLPSGATHPNWKVLKDRYDASKLPQAHTGKLRLWRKTSLRGFLQWEPNADLHWGGAFNYESAFIRFYAAAFVHYVHEGGAQQSILPAALFPGGTAQADYQAFMVAVTVGTRGADPKANKYRPATEMNLDPNYVWPYATAAHLGVQQCPPAGTALNQYDTYLDGVWTDTWRRYRAPLIHRSIQIMETQYGKMRGHMIGEFRSSPQYWVEKYYCDTCVVDHLLMEPTAAGGSANGEVCRMPACPGHLVSSETHTYNCNAAGCTQSKIRPVNQALTGQPCTRRCAGVLAISSRANILKRAVSATSTTYSCPVCGRSFSVMEAARSTGAQAGTVCGALCTGTYVDAGVLNAREITATAANMLGFPAAGEAMGGLWLFCTYPRGVSTWAHEIGHHKHLEHGPGGGGYFPNQHDSQTNAAVAGAANPVNRNWDRVCIMGYTRTGKNPGDADRGYFCGRCILKLRGWQVQGLALPPAGSGGP
jgi:hypothetical protein